MKQQKNKSSIMALIGVVAFIIIAAKVYYELKWYDLLIGISKLTFGRKKIALVSQKTLMFVTRKMDADTAIQEIMIKNGWAFVDKFGMGYVFSNEDEELLLKRRDFSFGYVVFEIYPRENYRRTFVD